MKMIIKQDLLDAALFTDGVQCFTGVEIAAQQTGPRPKEISVWVTEETTFFFTDHLHVVMENCVTMESCQIVCMALQKKSNKMK